MNAQSLAPVLTRRILVTAFVVILALLGIGCWYYRGEVQAVRQHKYEEIASIAKLKVEQIVRWRKERIADVSWEANSPSLSQALGEIAENGETPEVRDRMMKMLAIARNGAMCASVIVLSPSGQVLVSAGDSPVPIDAVTQRAVETARANPGGVLTDFFRIPEGEVDIDAVDAVRDVGGKLVGYLILRSRAADYLYSLIQSWPTPSRSAETLLVEREGQHVVFLNELRHRSKTALSFRNPLSQTNLPAVQAVMGKRGIFDGKDYRNVEVLADLSTIPGTPWFMVAKVDRDEIMAEARYRAASISVIVGALILLTLFAAAFAYKQQHARLLGKLFESERAQRETQELFRAILYSIADGVLTADTSGRIQKMNPVAERLTGWTEAEALGKPLDEVFVIINQATRTTVPNPAEGAVVGLANHTLLIARDGTECPIADSAAPIRDEGGVVRGVVLVFSDATLQDDLRKEQQLTKLVLDNLPGIFYLYSYPENRLILWNKQHELLLGYASEEMKDRHVTDWFAQEDKAAILQAIEVVMEKGQNSIEAPMLAKDGHRVPLLLTGVKFELQNKSYFIGIGTDITERKKADEAVRQSRNMLAHVLDSVPQAVFWKDRYSVYLGCNEVFARAVGLASPEEIVGKTDFDLPWSRHEAETYMADDREVMENKKSKRHIIEPLQQENGSRLWVDTSKVPLINATGDVFGILGVFEDISERKRIEEALSFSRQMLQQILDTMPQRVFWKDMELNYLGCNKMFALDTGFPDPQSLIGKSDHDTSSRGEIADRYRADDRSVIGSGKAKIGYEEPQMRPDGSMAWLRTSKVPLVDKQGRILGVLGTYEDISEYRQAQQALKEAKEEAETANRAKDQFIAVLSHELRTPLTPILLSSNAIETEEGVTEGIRAELEVIRRNVELEVKLIDDLLDVTRISRGKIQLHQEVVDAHVCFRNTLEICRSEITEKHLNVTLKLEATQPYVWADPARLQQVFWNLLRNAVKFTREGGEISIRSANIDGRLHMEFSDTGVGIDPNVISRIFDAFGQGEEGKARRFGGLGLGLSIAKAVVELHHGTLTAFSEGKDKGATFTLELAMVPDVKAPPVAPGATPSQCNTSLKILLVEDNADTLRILAKMLQKWGYTVRTADSVQSALEEAARESFDLLVSDVGLPDGSGLEIMRQVQKLYSVKGVAISGFGTEEDIRQSRAAGFGEHLVKPLDIHALHSSIQRISTETA